MTQKNYSEEQFSDIDYLLHSNCYKSIEEEFNDALKSITFAGMADECFGPFLMWLMGE
jgi:hypothetical protein